VAERAAVSKSLVSLVMRRRRARMGVGRERGQCCHSPAAFSAIEPSRDSRLEPDR
jgi:hypothetical protein